MPAGSEDPFLRIDCVSKTFGAFEAVKDVSLSVRKGEIFSLLGGSGCGKTTLLRMLAGFEEPTAGSIFLDGRDMAGVPPWERPVHMMFQSYALFPHMTVEANVGYGLKHERQLSRSDRNRRVAEMLDLVQLTAFAKRKPHRISGGQRQRVALARALARQPKLLLLDEPLAALDKKLREHTQFELMSIQKRTGVTFIVVTHDQEEAMTLSDRIAVMDNGKIMQTGTPADIYEFPQSRFVAGFIGSINAFEARVTGRDQGLLCLDVPALGCTVMAQDVPTIAIGQQVTLAVRPEKLRISKERPDTRNIVGGQVRDLAYFGKDSLYRISVDGGGLLQAHAVNAARGNEGARVAGWDDAVWISFEPSAALVLAA